MNDELESCVKGDPQPIFRYWPTIYVEGISKIRTTLVRIVDPWIKNFIQKSQIQN